MPVTLAFKSGTSISTAKTSPDSLPNDLAPDKLKAEKIKASVCAIVEHPFRYIKQVFGYSKVRYRGLAKNNNRLHLLAAFSSLLIGEKYLLA